MHWSHNFYSFWSDCITHSTPWMCVLGHNWSRVAFIHIWRKLAQKYNVINNNSTAILLYFLYFFRSNFVRSPNENQRNNRTNNNTNSLIDLWPKFIAYYILLVQIKDTKTYTIFSSFLWSCFNCISSIHFAIVRRWHWHRENTQRTSTISNNRIERKYWIWLLNISVFTPSFSSSIPNPLHHITHFLISEWF